PPYDIVYSTQLPDITDPVIIDGTTEPDYAGTPVVQVRAQDSWMQANTFVITGGNSIVRGLALVQAPGTSNTEVIGNAIVLRGAGGSRIEGNYVGVAI